MSIQTIQALEAELVRERAARQALEAELAASRRQTDALLRHKALLERLLNNLSVGIAYFDTDIVYRLVNETYARITVNRPISYYLDRSIAEVLPDTQGQTEQLLRRVIATGEPWRQQAWPVQLERNGRMEETYWEFEAFPMREADGRISGVVVWSVESTERVRLERENAASAIRIAEQAEALDREKAFAENLIAEVPAGIAYLDRNLIYQWVNPAQLRSWGVTPEQVLGRSAFTAFGPEVEATVKPVLQAVLDSGQAVSRSGFPVRFQRGGEMVDTYWDFTVAPVFEDGQTVQGVLLLSSEVTERVENEGLQAEHARLLAERVKALEDLDRYKDEFVSVISHELRTPLNFIMGFASTLHDEVQGPLNSGQREAVDKILNGADRMLKLVDDLLDFAKLQSGRFELTVAPTNFATVVDEVLGLMAPLAEQKHIALTASVAVPGTPRLDAARISQVLVNLVSNALKFTEPGGEVRLHAAVEGKVLRTTVTDTGCGIDAADLPRLFSRFEQLDMSKTRKASGTGLGLAITKALVEAHGGTVGVSSPGLGQGATFWFDLPLGEGKPARD